jgi:hypothetical protein
MPDTAHPVIRAFEAVFDLSGSVQRITALTVTCRHCSSTSSASEDNLVQLPGGRCSVVTVRLPSTGQPRPPVGLATGVVAGYLRAATWK